MDDRFGRTRQKVVWGSIYGQWYSSSLSLRPSKAFEKRRADWVEPRGPKIKEFVGNLQGEVMEIFESGVSECQS